MDRSFGILVWNSFFKSGGLFSLKFFLSSSLLLLSLSSSSSLFFSLKLLLFLLVSVFLGFVEGRKYTDENIY